MKLSAFFRTKMVGDSKSMLAILRKDPAYRVICHLEDGRAIYSCADGNPGKPTRILARITNNGSASALLDKAYELDNASGDDGWGPDESPEYVQEQMRDRQDALTLWRDLPVRYGPYCSSWVLAEHPLAPSSPGVSEADEVSNAKLVMLRKLKYRGAQLFITLSVILIVVILITVELSYLSAHTRGTTGPTLETRVLELTKSLGEASSAISSIENEVTARQKMVAQLKADASQYQALKDLNSAQVDAISQALRLQIKEEADYGYWSDIIKNFIFAVIGAIIGAMLGEVLAFIKKQTTD